MKTDKKTKSKTKKAQSEHPQIKFKVIDGVWLVEMGRLSFPNLFKPGKYEGADKPNLDCSFLIPKDQPDVIKAMKVEMIKLARRINPKIKKISQIKHPKFVEADDDFYVLKTSNSLDYPTIYVTKNNKLIRSPEEALELGADRELYAGCYVRAKITMNPVELNGQVKIWSNLTAIQFLEHGERFGQGQSDEEVLEGFEEVESDSEFEDESEDVFDDDSDDDSSDDFDDDDFDLDDE